MTIFQFRRDGNRLFGLKNGPSEYYLSTQCSRLRGDQAKSPQRCVSPHKADIENLFSK